MTKLKVALIATFRPIFQGDMKGVLKESIEKISSLSKELNFEFLPFDSGMETIEDAHSVKEQLEKENVDFILLQNSSFADGSMLMPFLSSSAYLGIWAVPETTDSGPLPLNSLCATNLYMSIPGRYAKDYNKPIKWFYGNTSDRDFLSRFIITIKALKTIKKLKKTKILLVGDIAPGFYNLTSNYEQIKRIFGSEVKKIELTEFYDEYHQVKNLGSYTGKLKEIQDQCREIKVSEDALNKSAVAETAIENLTEKYKAVAAGIQCWPNIPEELGLMVCSTLGRLNERGIITSCEGDIMGSLSMIILENLSGKKPMLMDLSAWDRETDSLYVWHCGNVPEEWFNDDGFVLDNHFNRKTMGSVRDGYLNDYKVTIMRFFENNNSALIAGGEFYKREKPKYKGVGGWMKDLKINKEAVSSYDFINTIMTNNIQHHLAYVNEDVSDELFELCAWLKIKPLEKIKYENFLQFP